MGKNNVVYVVVETESQLVQSRKGRLCLWLTQDGAEEGLKSLQRHYHRQEDRNAFKVREADLVLRPVLNSEDDVDQAVDTQIGSDGELEPRTKPRQALACPRYF